MSDALERLQHELAAAQRALAEAEVRHLRQESEHQSAVKEAENTRKQVEQAHQEWISVLDAAEDPIFVHDKDFRVLRCNQAYQRSAGIPFKKIIGQPYYEVFPKIHAPLHNCLQELEKAEAEEEVSVGDTNYRSRAYSVKDGRGNYLYSVHTLENINERKRISVELRESEQRYRQLFEAAGDGILILDAETGKVVDANPFILDLLSYSLSECTGKMLWEIGLFKDVKASKAAFRKLQSKGYIRYEDMPLQTKDGRQIDVEFVSNLYAVGARQVVQCNVRDITERMQVKRLLQASEIRYRRLFETAKDGILILDAETGKILDANPFILKLLSYRLDECIGKMLWQIGLFKDIEASKEAFDELQTIGYIRYEDLPLQTKDGRRIEVEFVSNLYEVGERKVIQCNVRDITERKADEASLKIFRALLDNSSDAIEVLDPVTMRFLDVNETECRSLGYSRKELLSMRIFDIDPEFGEDSAKLLQQQIQSRGGTQFDTMHRRKDGSTFPVEVSIKLVEIDKPYLLSIARDITERKLAEHALRASEDRIRTMFEQAPLGIALIDSLSGHFCEVNMRFAEIAGRSMEELLNTEWLQITHPDDVQADLDNMALLNAGKINGFQMEKRYLHPDGEVVWIDMTVRPLEFDDQTSPRHLSMIQDISERKKSEASIKYLNRVLSVLSGINTLIVRVTERDELFGEACQIAVDAGGFRMAMLVIVDPVTMLPASITSAGKNEELLAEIKNVLSSSVDMQKTLIWQAIKEKKAIISNDTQNDPRLLFGKHYTEAGVNSMTVLPLIISGEAVGILALYASEINFFQKDEMKLLAELAGDIAYAIDHINKQERLNYLAYYDVLTGLANRTLFLERVVQYMHSATSSGYKLAIGLIDIDRFKSINDSLGRSTGDALLKQVAEWLTRKTGDANLLARVDADHFAVVLPEVKSDGNLAKMVESLMVAFLDHRFHMNKAELRIGIKAGIALFPDDGNDADILFRNAEAALKRAKATGEQYLFHTQKMTESVAGKLTLENQLREAIDNEEFVLHYQPKVSLVSGKVTSAEALIRWNDPHTGLVPPGTFIPILEETGLIYEVGRWALRKAIEDNLRWRNTGLPAVRIAVNVSPLQLRNINFIGEIKQAIALDAHAAAGLELEITESVIMDEVEHNIASLQAIRDLGITIAIDDFGTGFSSLSYLAKLPVDTLKIDRAFVIEMTAGPEGLALVSTIISLAHALNLKVVAEGVETEEQAHLLRLHNCDEMQGFLFSKPVPVEVFEARFMASLTLDKEPGISSASRQITD